LAFVSTEKRGDLADMHRLLDSHLLHDAPLPVRKPGCASISRRSAALSKVEQVQDAPGNEPMAQVEVHTSGD